MKLGTSKFQRLHVKLPGAYAGTDGGGVFYSVLPCPFLPFSVLPSLKSRALLNYLEGMGQR